MPDCKTAESVEISEKNKDDSIVTNGETSGTEDTAASSIDDSYGTKLLDRGFIIQSSFGMK